MPQEGFGKLCFHRDPAPGSVVKGQVIVTRTLGRSSPGRSTILRLYSSTQVDSKTGKGKLSNGAHLKHGKNTKHGKIKTKTYRVTFNLEADFGTPGAVVVKNGNKSEFHLKYVSLLVSEDRSIQFDCNSWVYPFKKTKIERLFFVNTSYLPAHTPSALRNLRREELQSLRGDGRGERKPWDRIYDYDYYNDLGEPDKGLDHVRPVLGGTMTHPYPRRIRTGRPLSEIDGVTEKRHKLINLDFYVPPDERFNPVKLSEFITNAVQAVVHFVIPEVGSLLQGDITNFKSFDQLTKDLYSKKDQQEKRQPSAFEGVIMEKLKPLIPEEIYKEVASKIKEHPVKFPVPQVIASDDDAWRTDEEFAREMLAGLNPTMIKRLEVFPPVGRGGKQSSITASHVEGQLEGLTIIQAMEQKRIFILDHHDYLMPYLRRINAQGICVYASRTLLFLKKDGTLKLLVIELTSPEDDEKKETSRVFLPSIQGSEGAALWQLAKAQVAVNDSGYHQLISHWLFTHATVEPFIIATRRQLSSMHPIYKLLDPHFKDTMHINSLARSVLLNAGGILEKTMFPDKYAMELSSSIYDDWSFEDQALPQDLIKRGLAIENPGSPSGVSLLIEDYPYAVDGLEVWTAIKTWVANFCAHFYHDNAAVIDDEELQLWWREVRHVGHGDKGVDEDDGWPPLNTVPDLTQVLTTLIWTASALHAAVNFGQYAYAGFPPNRPTRCRKYIPSEGTPQFAEFIKDPDRYFFDMLPDRFTTTLGVALIEVLSGHAGDEVYLGQRTSAGWTDDGEVLRLFEEFGESLRKVGRRIEERNKDAKLKNRKGPAKVPYTLLYPDTSNVGGEKGVTGKGIPNSVSI
ncbi:linoleate 9S-lipoxygenase A-like [Typha latifolia]|uniref:linoleate 9S-lipoxygenase A-like n=1 Tax=Typha latifolia TaxID=4733 RepID=UPI003C305E83